MFISVSYLAVSFACFREGIELSDAREWKGALGFSLLVASFLCLGAGIGALVKRPVVGAAIALAIVMYIPCVVALLLGIVFVMSELLDIVDMLRRLWR